MPNGLDGVIRTVAEVKAALSRHLIHRVSGAYVVGKNSRFEVPYFPSGTMSRGCKQNSNIADTIRSLLLFFLFFIELRQFFDGLVVAIFRGFSQQFSTLRNVLLDPISFQITNS